MSPPSSQTILHIAGETGHRPATVEKILRLLDLLVGVNKDPYLAGRLVLKGGTALNVFHLDLDRLSVDIDLNYIGGLDRAVMVPERQGVDAAMSKLLGSRGYSLRRKPIEHAGGKWLSRFNSVLGGNATLEVDINYIYRQPLFGAAQMESRSLGRVQARGILVLDIHEIVAGKIVALVNRRAARDLFDARRILSIEGLDWARIKTAVLAIGACSSEDWRNASINAVSHPADSHQKLLHCLPQNSLADYDGLDAWIDETIALCREGLRFLFNLSTNEQAFLDGVLDRGEIDADLLDTEPETRNRINAMPMLAWKALHARKRD